MHFEICTEQTKLIHIRAMKKKKNNNNGKNEEKRDQNVVDKLKKNFEMLPYAIFCKLCKNTFP